MLQEHGRLVPRRTPLAGALLALILLLSNVHGAILWSDMGSTLAHENGDGADLLGGVLYRDDDSSGVLYFKVRVAPISDVTTEEFFAAFQFFQGDRAGLAIGNSLKAWAYSAFNTAVQGEGNAVAGDVDLKSMRPDPSTSAGVLLPYELPRRGIENVIVFKVTFVPGGDDEVKVWLNPDLSAGAREENQPLELTTEFPADASFNQVRVRHGGGGGGWRFSEMAIATAFDDFCGGDAAGLPESARTIRGGSRPMTFRTWQREQGFPQNSVSAIAQTPEGYLWIAGDDGVSRFDGARFLTFSTRDGLPTHPVRVLLADSSGRLWAGTAGGGVARWDGDRFVLFRREEGLASESVHALAEIEEELWVGTDSGLQRWVTNRFEEVPHASVFRQRRIPAIARARQGAWIAAQGLGVFLVTPRGLEAITNSAVDPLLKDVHALLEDSRGRVWIAAGDDFILCREGGEWRRHRIPRQARRAPVSTLIEAPDGAIWAGAAGEGLFEFRDGRIKRFNSGFADNVVNTVAFDREGNLWVGTSGGLSRLRRSTLTVFSASEGLDAGPVHGIAELRSGTMLAAKPGGGIYERRDGLFRKLPASHSAFRSGTINALLVSQDGQCWMGGTSGLLQIAEPDNLNSDPQTAIASAEITALLETRDGSVWAATRDGALWKFSGGRRSVWPAAARSITALAQSPEGFLWIGTDGQGVLPLESPNAPVLDKRAGLLSDSIRTLYVDADGTLWIGTGAGGLARWRDGKLTNFTTREGLPDNTISQILEDEFGRLWIGSNRGVAGITKSELEAVAVGTVQAVHPIHFGRSEGMPSEECTGGYSPAGLKSRSGTLWFPTGAGVVVIDPTVPGRDSSAPAVRLEEVFVDGTSVSFRAATSPEARDLELVPLLIAPGKKRIEFHYTALTLAAPERVRFRYRLQGVDPEWVEAGTRRSVFYGHLPPGDYRFEVKACAAGGLWSDLAVALPLRVERRFYQSWWFIGMAAVGLILLAGAGARLVERRKNQARVRLLEQERAVARERARIAQDLHDDLGSSLTRISLLSDALREEAAQSGATGSKAAKISQAAAQTVRALEEIVWALRPGSDTAQGLVEYIAHFAKELFDGEETRCRLDFPSELPELALPPEVRHNAFLIVKEALTNALKHARAREVVVRGQFSSHAITLSVVDDGRGWDVERRSPTRNGVENMRRRAESMRGDLQIESSPGGTCVTLTLQRRNLRDI